MCGNLSFKFKGQTCLNQAHYHTRCGAPESVSKPDTEEFFFNLSTHFLCGWVMLLNQTYIKPYILHRYITTNHATGYGLEPWAPWIGWRIAVLCNKSNLLVLFLSPSGIWCYPAASLSLTPRTLFLFSFHV